MGNIIFLRHDDIKEGLRELPGWMRSKRMSMDAPKGFQPGIRRAAGAVGISPTTYARLENGYPPDMQTFLKILKWLES